jgi:hypothetical protein
MARKPLPPLTRLLSLPDRPRPAARETRRSEVLDWICAARIAIAQRSQDPVPSWAELSSLSNYRIEARCARLNRIGVTGDPVQSILVQIEQVAPRRVETRHIIRRATPESLQRCWRRVVAQIGGDRAAVTRRHPCPPVSIRSGVIGKIGCEETLQ